MYTALSLPLSPITSPDMPRSTILNNIACTARLSLWFCDLVLATFMSDRIVLRMYDRSAGEEDCGRRGNRDLSSLKKIRKWFTVILRDILYRTNDFLISEHH